MSLVLASSTALIPTPAFAVNIAVSDAAGLSNAIATAAAGDRIVLQNDITLDATPLPPILANITIDGDGHAIDAQNNNRIFFLDSTATIRNVTLIGGKASGGNGGDGGIPGGGGLGAGGAIFVNSGVATIANVSFANNAAAGGDAGHVILGDSTSGSGGGSGFGGGGAGGSPVGGNGGFGGGGGASDSGMPGTGGTGGGTDCCSDAGGGAGFGGAVFVRDGAGLTVADGSFSGGSITAGTGSNGLANGAAAGTDLFLMSGATTTFNPAGTLTFSGSIADDSAASLPAGQSFTAGSSAGAAIAITGGTVALNGANTFSGGTIINNGAVAVAGSNAAFGAGGVTLDNGTVQAGADNLDLANAISLGNGGGTLDTQTHTLTLSGSIGDVAGQSGSLTKTGSGTLVLANTGTYTGATTIEAGTLTAGVNQALPASTAVAVNSGATLRIADSTLATIGSLADGSSGGGTVSIGAAAGLSIGNNGADAASTTFSGIISGASIDNALQYAGGGTLMLTGTGSQIGGTLMMGTPALSRTGPAGELKIDGGTFEAGSGVFVLDGKLTVSGGATLTSNAPAIVSGTNTAQVLVTGTGSNLNVANGMTVGNFPSFPGPAYGKLTIADGGTVTVTTNSNVDIGADGILELGTGGLAGTFAGPSIQNDGQIVANFTDSSALAATVLGNGSITKQGGGTLTLSGASNSYSGGTLLQGGALELTNSSSLGAGALTMDASTTLLIQSSFGSFSNDVTLNGDATFKINSAASGPLAGEPIVIEAGGTIGGSGALIKTGDSTLALMRANTYLGGTVISQGTLQIANAGSLGTGTVTFDGGTLQPGINNLTLPNAVAINTTGGTVNVNSAMTFTLGGVIADGDGAGTLTKTGGGTLVLSRSNTYSGGTSLQGGTLRLTDNAALGTGVLVTSDTARIDYANGVTIGNAITITGGGLTLNTGTGVTAQQSGAITSTDQSILKFGSGTLVVNDVGAPMYVAGGTVKAGAVNAFAASGGLYVFLGTFDLGGFNQTLADFLSTSASTFTNNGTSAATLTLTSPGITPFDGTLTDGSQPLGLTFNAAAGTAIALTGANTYTGATMVTSGILQVDGSITSASTVESGGILAGSGQVGPVTVNNGGALLPGAVGTPGTLTVNGNLAMTSGAAYVVFANPTTIGSTLVTGAATLDGTVVVNAQTGQHYQAGQYTLMTVQGGITGGSTFAALNTLGFGYSVRNPRLDYDANHVYLLFDTGTISPQLNGSGGQNQRNVAAAIDAVLLGGGIPTTAFGTLLNLQGAALAQGLAQVAGESAGGLAQAGIQFGTSFLNLMLNPLGGGAPGSGASALGYAREVGARLSPDAAAAYAIVTPRDRRASGDSFAARWSLWGGGFGGWSRTAGDAAAGSSDLTARTYGFAGGADYHVSPDTLLGFALAGGGTNWNVAQVSGGGRSDVFQAGVYGSHRFGAAYFSAAATYGWHSVRTDRTVTIAGADRLTAAFNAYSVGGRIEAGYRLAMPAVAVTPYLAAQAQAFRTPAYGETAASGLGTFALNYDGRSTTATRIELGAWLDRTVTLAHGDVLVLRGRAAWAHDHSDNGINAAFQTLPGAAFTVDGAPMPADSVLLSAGADYRLAGGLSVGARFDSELSRRGQTYSGLGSVRYAW